LILGFLALSGGAIKLPGKWGYFQANATYDVDYFYWIYDPASATSSSSSTSSSSPNTDPTNAPVVLWLTGGPGCSSELAMFFENGPYQVNAAGTGIIPNKYGWNQHNYLLYVDQPGGTGFSTVGNPDGYVTDQAQVAADMGTFLSNFFDHYASLADNDFFIFGESFAGHYVPAISAYIVENMPEIKLKGIAIGNGLIDPYYQNPAYGPFIWAHGKMTENQLNQVQSMVPSCESAITKSTNMTQAFTLCGNMLNQAMEFCQENNNDEPCNIYDIIAPCVGELCYNFSNINTFLNSAPVQEALGLDIPWQACVDGQVYAHLEADFERSYAFDLPTVLDANVPVTIYNGNLDIICNFYGETEVVNNLEWSGQDGFLAALNNTWNLAGEAVGNYRSFDNFTFVVVYNAGHMVPHDQPAAALDLMERVLANTWPSTSSSSSSPTTSSPTTRDHRI